jgi:GNAT superfamily N-acetyltransferase
MEVIKHTKIEDWGVSIYIMEKNGKAFGRVYWYNDDFTTVYLDSLSVQEPFRKQKLGTELQKIRESFGFKIGATFSALWVEKDSFQHKWYKRRGYEDWKECDKKPNCIWMRKNLIK